MITVFVELFVILLLVLLNGFFAMSELAVVSSRRGRLKQLADDGSRGAQAALALTDDPGRFLSAAQIGITAIGILAGAYSGATLAQQLGAWLAQFPPLVKVAPTLGIALVVLGITYLSLIVGELVPKRIALSNAERVAALVARPMTLLARVSAPMVWFLHVSSEGVLRLLGLRADRQVTVTEEEVKSMVAEGAEAGVFEAAERDMIDGVLRLSDRPARSIMTPRVDVIWLDLEDDLAKIGGQITTSGCSRFPACRGDIDSVEGIVHTKDLLVRQIRGEPFDLVSCVRDALFVHESTPVLKLLEMFRSSSVHMAVVVDEYGSFEGIVTPTDILAAITGQLHDDEAEAEPAAVRRDDGSWLVDGRTDIVVVEKLLERRGLQSEEDDYHTLAGFILWEMGHLPHIGEGLNWQGLRFEVVDMDGRRIDRVLISTGPDHAGVEVEVGR